MLFQRTIAKTCTVTGIGLHSGKKVKLTLHPAPENFGIQFRRTDIKNSKLIKADAKTVGATENATSLGAGAEAIHTVEHLLAVLYGLGINNVLCELYGPEVPIMDGSGASFIFLLKEIGVANLNKSKKFLIVLEPVKVAVGDRWAQIEPANKLIIDSTIVFPHPRIKTQQKIFEFTCENFIEDIGRARTFGFYKDVDALKRKGLIRGASLDNAVVLDDFQIVNHDGLRYTDEFVRHKILDTLGDISLLGYEIAGKVTTYKSGHNIHNLLCRKLLETPSAFEIVSANALQEEARRAFDLPVAINIAH